MGLECLSVFVKRNRWSKQFAKPILLRLLLFCIMYILYVCGGALFYHIVEGAAEVERMMQEPLVVKKNNLKYYEIEEDLDQYAQQLININGIGQTSQNGTYESNWTFAKSLFFVSTILTTIGYGHVTPQTTAGKLFTMAYATIGIPLTLVFLSAFVERLLVVVMHLLVWLNKQLSHTCRPFTIRLLHLVCMVTFLIVVFLLLPAMLIAYVEPQWNFLDAFYFTFISLTTIGLGDYIPGEDLHQEHRDIYKICITVYLYVGTTFMMLLLAVFYDIPELNFGRLFIPSDTKIATSGDNDSDTQLSREANLIMERARLSKPSLGLGLQYGLDSTTSASAIVAAKQMSGDSRTTKERGGKR